MRNRDVEKILEMSEFNYLKEKARMVKSIGMSHFTYERFLLFGQ